MLYSKVKVNATESVGGHNSAASSSEGSPDACSHRLLQTSLQECVMLEDIKIDGQPQRSLTNSEEKEMTR